MRTVILPSTKFDVSRTAFSEQLETAVREKFGTLDKAHSEFYNKELELIKSVPDEWLSYLLIASDLVKHMRTTYPFSVSEGRGTIVASFAAYLLDITEIDPVLYGLSPERFYVNAKTSPIPCVDLDIASDYRQCATNYLSEMYGTINLIVPITNPITKSHSGKKGVHACAFFIAPSPYDELCELAEIKNAKYNVVDKTADELEELGFIRFNLLSSKTQQYIMNLSAEKFNIFNVSDYRSTFSSENLKDLSYDPFFKNFKYDVNSFDDVLFILAASRDYSLWSAASKEATLGYTYGDSTIDRILKNTNGVILFQEQINDILSYVLDIDYYQANSIRKNITKKKGSVVRHAQAEITQSLLGKALDTSQITALCSNLIKACEYSTLKAHMVSVAYNLTEYLSLKA